LIIGKLSNLNSSYIIPTLRKYLIKVLFKLEYSNEIKIKEENIRYLNNLILSCPRIIKQYLSNIISILINIIGNKNLNEQISIMCLSTIGRLARVDSLEFEKYLKDVIPITILAIEEVNFETKLIGITTLCNICKYTGNYFIN
jgi:FKBP12-rapamycin complex-associated protein